MSIAGVPSPSNLSFRQDLQDWDVCTKGQKEHGERKENRPCLGSRVDIGSPLSPFSPFCPFVPQNPLSGQSCPSCPSCPKCRPSFAVVFGAGFDYMLFPENDTESSMPCIKPISELRNYNRVLNEVSPDSPVFPLSADVLGAQEAPQTGHQREAHSRHPGRGHCGCSCGSGKF